MIREGYKKDAAKIKEKTKEEKKRIQEEEYTEDTRRM